MRALGFSRIAILTSFVLEAMFLAATGGAIGVMLGTTLSLVKFSIVNFQTGSDIVIRFAATPSLFISALIFAAVMGLIGGLGPAVRASRVSPAEAMRG